MNWNTCVRNYRRSVLVGLGLFAASSLAVQGMAQEGFRPTPRDDRQRNPRTADARTGDNRYQDGRSADNQSNLRDRQNHNPTLSEATALLEAAVRTMYKNIEPDTEDSSPNELLAYADLRALRLYTGALEVAGWSLEQAASDYQRYQSGGAYRGGYRNTTDDQAQAALERYRAYRETARTLLLRVRETAVSVEHQVSFCDPSVSAEWRQEVLPVLRDAVAATDPIFQEQQQYQGYAIPGQAATKVIPASNTGGMPRDAVDVNKSPVYQPYNGQGRGQGRYFEIRAFGGAVRVKSIRFKSQENAFGLLGTTGVRELAVDQVAEPGRPLFIPGNRRRWVDVTNLEVEWEGADRDRRAYGTIELVETSPDDANN